MLPLTLALLAQLPDDPDTPPPPQEVVSYVTVQRTPKPDAEFLDVTDGNDSWCYTLRSFGEPEIAIVWHLDDAVKIPLAELTEGTPLRVRGPSMFRPEKIEVMTLGPLAMSVAVEEFVAEAAGDRLAEGLTPGECETVAALGSRAWFVRDAVFRALRERGRAALPLLVWASRQRDGEIRERARVLLRRLGWSG